VNKGDDLMKKTWWVGHVAGGHGGIIVGAPDICPVGECLSEEVCAEVCIFTPIGPIHIMTCNACAEKFAKQLRKEEAHESEQR
jgi:hypothetical protein